MQRHELAYAANAGSCGRFARTADRFFTTVSAPRPTRVFLSIRASRSCSAADMSPIIGVKSLPAIRRQPDPRRCARLLNPIATCHPEQGERPGHLPATALWWLRPEPRSLALLGMTRSIGAPSAPCSPHHPVVLWSDDEASTASSIINTAYYLIWPVPTITYFDEVSSASAKGPRQWSFWVLMPISAPIPNSPPSVKRVEAFQ